MFIEERLKIDDVLIQMNVIKVLGYNIRFIKLQSESSKGNMVLLHGLGASAERWSELIPFIKDYDVYIPDLIGFGYSEKPLIEYSIPLFTKFLEEFFEKVNIKDPIVIGSSFGGQLVVEFYLTNKNKIKKMILVSPAGTQEKPTFALSHYVFSALYPTYENTERSFKMMSSQDYQVKDSIIKDFNNRMRLPNAKYSLMSTLLALRKNPLFKERLKEIEIPTLIIWGENDMTIPVQNIEHFKVIPNSKAIIMKNCGHVPFVEKPQEFFELIKDFMESD